MLRHALDEEQITRILQDSPAVQDVPRLAADLMLALRGAAQLPDGTTLQQETVQALVHTVDPPRALNHLLRYLDMLGDPEAFWTACTKRSGAVAALMHLFAGSPYLSAILWRRPALLFWLLDDALWQPLPTSTELAAQLDQELDGKASEAEVATTLRAFTSQHLLRLGARDLAQLADVEETTADLSALADCVLQAGVDACQRWLLALHGAPMYTDDAGEEHPCGFGVIGMGKLGGYELNFSSDIDLMYVYTSYQGQTTGVMCDGVLQGQISNHEYFITLARRLTNLVGGKGPNGQAFRIDLRLRPDGTQGQLALALLAYEAYYARFGQTWEKMALLKARLAAGDAALGAEFMALIHPFVYERHLDREGIRHLQEMKTQIDAQMEDREQSRTNVKLGIGGIREIEFLIQLPQLLFGGRQPELQECRSLRALTKLCQAGLMSPEVETTLRQTYIYLRRMEHRLQMEQGTQTHVLPRGEEPRLRLARHFGYATWEDFYQDYLHRTEAIHTLFVEAFRARVEAAE